jgi:endonuclease/exonuclease/phosphatase family metal-dependent hydrolase
LGALLGVAACDKGSPYDPNDNNPPGDTTTTTPAQVDIGNWNIEWFGSTSNGPSNETLQAQNVTTVLSGANVDIWGIEEVVDTTRFRQVVNNLSGYGAMVANDPFVTGGPQYYSDFSNTEQKVALLYRKSAFTLVSAKVILTAYDFEFAGRPPVEYRLRTSKNQDLVVIVMHAKAGADSASYNRRTAAAGILKGYLDATYPTQKVWVIGDFNDDLDVSIYANKPTPYASFLSDAARYAFATKELTDANISTEVNFPTAIDHQLGTNEVFASFVKGSAHVLRPDATIASYGTTTSDHFPVVARYAN